MSPKIIVHTPSQVKVQVGQELRLFVEAVCGLGGKLTYQWFRDGEKLNYGTTSEMLVNPARLEDQGAYSCRITSEHGGSSLSDITQVIGQLESFLGSWNRRWFMYECSVCIHGVCIVCVCMVCV